MAVANTVTAYYIKEKRKSKRKEYKKMCYRLKFKNGFETVAYIASKAGLRYLIEFKGLSGYSKLN